MRCRSWVLLGIGILLALIRDARSDCTLTVTGKTPLNDLGSGTYLGQQGGLYPNGDNIRPAAHEAAGILIAQNEIVPRDAQGAVDWTNGKIVLISVGMSNTVYEFATRGPGAFLPRFNLDNSRNPKIVAVNCAQGNHAVAEWRNPNNNAWSTCYQRLANAGVTREQVQVAWVKLAERTTDVPDTSFPAHAQFHRTGLGEVMRLLKTNFVNLDLAFLSSRIRCYENNPNSLNPEPFAYEENFSVKWLIEDQINGASDLNFDSSAGAVVAPHMSWGPYLWADGETPRSDGLAWQCSDLVADFTHPSESGARKVADQLFAFFRTDPLATPWFLRHSVVGQPPIGQLDVSVEVGPAPLIVQFTGTVSDSDGSVVEQVWTFADGGYAFGGNPAKVFHHPGNYNVRWTAIDDDGNAMSQERLITVTAAGVPIPTVSACGVGTMAIVILVGGWLALQRSRDRNGCNS